MIVNDQHSKESSDTSTHKVATRKWNIETLAIDAKNALLKANGKGHSLPFGIVEFSASTESHRRWGKSHLMRIMRGSFGAHGRRDGSERFV